MRAARQSRSGTSRSIDTKGIPSGDPSLHDPCVMAFLIDPTLFKGVDAVIEVDCDPAGAYGRTRATLVEGGAGNGQPVCHVVTEVDDERLFQLIDLRLRRLQPNCKTAA